AGAFRRVRRDRQRCPTELILHVSTATRQPLHDLPSETNEIDGHLIGVQLLVVEVRHPHPSTEPSAQLRTIDSIAGTGTGTGRGREGPTLSHRSRPPWEAELRAERGAVRRPSMHDDARQAGAEGRDAHGAPPLREPLPTMPCDFDSAFLADLPYEPDVLFF